ncbi:DUF397 domain-containing protein [Streptomyces sp. NBC_01387]|uniref:DUF397 domain-containing protein n=1 Tax=unclassified Streptomyces TaxID=2593676 RepID=UPI0020247A8A|nr:MULTISPECIES: DUF397 domain-containing protein [unclassified Streptomyces]WSC21880.1 DUF397 domain-containing protein [Streptomyces sp. NBC_01766]WSV55835.1 DUF397 domain-containing protein [Streptomyces sp. NBC_01014]
MNSNARIVPDPAFIREWRKSSFSGPGNDDCLEVADGYAAVPVRDSKNPHGPALLFPATGWASFVAAVKSGRLSA